MDNQSEPATAHKAKCQYYRRVKRAEARALTLTVYFSCIIAAFLVISLGFHNISGYGKFQMEKAVVELKSQDNIQHREQILSSRLDDLLSTRLTHKYFESYEDCLARGLRKADEHFFGQGFQHSTIRNEAITWTTENCKRLSFTPQVSESSPGQAIRARFTQSVYSAGKLIERALALFRVHRAWQHWFGGHVATHHIPGPTVEPADHRSEVTSTNFAMPFGFELRCDQAPPCRLVYPMARNQIYQKTMSDEDLGDVVSKAMLWIQTSKLLDLLQRPLGFFAYVFLLAELHCFLIYKVLSETVCECASCHAAGESTMQIEGYEPEKVWRVLGFQIIMVAIYPACRDLDFLGNSGRLACGVFLVALGCSMLASMKGLAGMLPAFRELLVVVYVKLQDSADTPQEQTPSVSDDGTESYPGTPENRYPMSDDGSLDDSYVGTPIAGSPASSYGSYDGNFVPDAQYPGPQGLGHIPYSSPVMEFSSDSQGYVDEAQFANWQLQTGDPYYDETDFDSEGYVMADDSSLGRTTPFDSDDAAGAVGTW